MIKIRCKLLEAASTSNFIRQNFGELNFQKKTFYRSCSGEFLALMRSISETFSVLIQHFFLHSQERCDS